MNKDAVEERLKSIETKLHRIDITLMKQHTELTEHIRRTTNLETKMEPLQQHMYYLHGAIKLISVIGLIGGALMILSKLLGKS